MKKIIALLLALAMIFAFAACKGKDDNKDTTADSTQGAGADVQDTQAGGEDTTAAEAPSGDSTAAPSEGGSEAATQGQQGGTQGSADINAPVNGSKADIVAFFNKYATAMKQYKGKVTVKRVQGRPRKSTVSTPIRYLVSILSQKQSPCFPTTIPRPQHRPSTAARLPTAQLLRASCPHQSALPTMSTPQALSPPPASSRATAGRSASLSLPRAARDLPLSPLTTAPASTLFH